MNTAEIVTRFPQREDGTISITPDEMHHLAMHVYRDGLRHGKEEGRRETLEEVAAKHPSPSEYRERYSGGKLPVHTISR